MLLRLAYLGLTNTFALLRLLPRTGQDKDTEILVLRHQIALLQRQLGDTKVRFSPTDRALLAALRHRMPHQALKAPSAGTPRHHSALAPRITPPTPRRSIPTQRPGRPRTSVVQCGRLPRRSSARPERRLDRQPHLAKHAYPQWYEYASHAGRPSRRSNSTVDTRRWGDRIPIHAILLWNRDGTCSSVSGMTSPIRGNLTVPSVRIRTQNYHTRSSSSIDELDLLSFWHVSTPSSTVVPPGP